MTWSRFAIVTAWLAVVSAAWQTETHKGYIGLGMLVLTFLFGIAWGRRIRWS